MLITLPHISPMQSPRHVDTLVPTSFSDMERTEHGDVISLKLPEYSENAITVACSQGTGALNGEETMENAPWSIYKFKDTSHRSMDETHSLDTLSSSSPNRLRNLVHLKPNDGGLHVQVLNATSEEDDTPSTTETHIHTSSTPTLTSPRLPSPDLSRRVSTEGTISADFDTTVSPPYLSDINCTSRYHEEHLLTRGTLDVTTQVALDSQPLEHHPLRGVRIFVDRSVA